MSAGSKKFKDIKPVIISAQKHSTLSQKADFYNLWAKNYEQDASLYEFSAPTFAANSLSNHFRGDREKAVVLDVACGTGLVAKRLKSHGFGQFVGVDGSEAMLELARQTGLYQELKQLLLGEEPLPVQWADSFDAVTISGALSVGHVPVAVVRELCKATKPGGYICMTTRSNNCNLEYKGALDLVLKKMEEEGLWVCVDVIEVKDWERAVLEEEEEEYIPGVVYVYQKI